MPRARSSAKVSRPCWSQMTFGSTPFSASEAMVRTKFDPSPTTQLVRTM